MLILRHSLGGVGGFITKITENVPEKVRQAAFNKYMFDFTF